MFDLTKTWKFSTRMFAAMAFGLVAVCQTTALAGPVVYVSGDENELGTLDLSTGVFTESGMYPLPFMRGDVEFVFGLGFTGPGQLTALSPRGNYYSVNPATAETTLLGHSAEIGQPNSGIEGGGGDGQGNIYAEVYHIENNVFASTLERLNIASGVLTPIAPFTNSGFIAVGPDGNVYLDGFDGTQDALFRINPTTGIVTDLGPTGIQQQILAGVFVGSTLYAFDAVNEILTFDLTTGAGTNTGVEYSLPDEGVIFAAAFQATPEPSSLLLAALGTGFAGMTRLIRSRRVLTDD